MQWRALVVRLTLVEDSGGHIAIVDQHDVFEVGNCETKRHASATWREAKGIGLRLRG